MDEMHAILTPSTKGLRETLKDITFTMPLAANQIVNNTAKDQNDSLNNENVTNDASTNNSTKDFSSNKDDPPTTVNTSSDKINCSKDTEKDADDDNDDDDDEENDDQDNEEIDEFLEKIGLNSAVNFKSSNLQRNNKEAQKDSLLYFDSRPRSTLLFSQGGDVQALFNFLLNSKACILSSGPLTGVPPTLLSPLPFVGAALQKIKVEQNVIKSLTKTGDPLTQYALDFIGPIMPFHVHRLCNLFRATQQNEFDMVANTYEQSSALNCVKNSADVIVDKEQMSKYLDMSEMESLENGYGVFGEATSIKSICIKDDMFCCN
jgi:protein downstream neighbor of Son